MNPTGLPTMALRMWMWLLHRLRRWHERLKILRLCSDSTLRREAACNLAACLFRSHVEIGRIIR
jgi:hypothetical protein